MTLVRLIDPSDPTLGVVLGEGEFSVDENGQVVVPEGSNAKHVVVSGKNDDDVMLGVLLLRKAGPDVESIAKLANELKNAKNAGELKFNQVLAGDDANVVKFREQRDKLKAKLEEVEKTLNDTVKALVGETSKEDEETLAAKQEEFKAARQSFNKRYALGVEHAEETSIEGLKDAFDWLKDKIPGRVSTGTSAGGGSQTGASRPRVKTVIVNGENFDNFTKAALKIGGKASDIGAAWLSAAGADDWTKVESAVEYEYSVTTGDETKTYTINVLPREKEEKAA